MNWTKGLFRLWVLYLFFAVAYVAQSYWTKIQVAFSPIPKARFVYPIEAAQTKKFKVPRGIETKKVTLTNGLRLQVEAETKSEATAVVEKLIADGKAETISELARSEIFVGVMSEHPIAVFPIDLERRVAEAAMHKEFANEMSLSAKAQVLSRLLVDMLLWAFSPLIAFVCVKWVWRGFRPIP
jgi:hypothetical protein